VKARSGCRAAGGRLSTLLPIFPLDAVLLPGVPLPLHVFEPRYKEMIGECLEEKKPFGVVRAKEDGVAEIGCTAEILRVTKKYPDGRMDIITEGRRRFEMMEVNQERSFLRAEVFYLADEHGRATPDEIQRAMKLYGEIMTLGGGEDESDHNNEILSFKLAGSLPLDLDFKQTLLGLNSEAERMQALITCFESILPNLRRTVEVRKRAGGNGHVH